MVSRSSTYDDLAARLVSGHGTLLARLEWHSRRIAVVEMVSPWQAQFT
jgi:hypothetical protein